MNGRRTLPTCLAAAALLLAAGGVSAENAAYKCGSATYSDVACSGGQVVGPQGHRATNRSQAVPQDRATIARRATLTEEERAECRTLDVKKAEQEKELKAKGDGVTLQDEMPLVFTKKRLRELRC
ncbi:MAG TPA: hypothetical protein VF522_18355 [Ramlibacter sp.]|uniref:hypothetical protein n=1 Tax=Ramlibacter sp. TaxID=1917967 RepID=UPI002ED0D90F